MAKASTFKDTVCSEIDSYEETLNGISTKIWANPETAFKEKYAHGALTEFLEEKGFTVSKSTPLETSFIARFGNSNGPRIGVMCEYDALPGIGHACGHNLIAEAGLAAALGLKAVFSKDGTCDGEVIVYGTPAEEGGGGKVLMLQEGCFNEVDVCLMVHPADADVFDASEVFIAREVVRVTYTGKAAHAAAAPWEGVNALDAAVSCYNAVSMMRQQIKPTWRVHGIFTDGGAKPNIIPATAQLTYYLRAPTVGELEVLKTQFMECAKGAGEATGCKVKIEVPDSTYLNVLKNERFTELYKNNAKSLGLKERPRKGSLLASTDAGNISYHCPTIHPVFSIPAEGSIHTESFQKAAGSTEAQAPTILAGKAMAMTAIDILCDPSLLEAIKEEFTTTKKLAEGKM